jgi:hypothetical protein
MSKRINFGSTANPIVKSCLKIVWFNVYQHRNGYQVDTNAEVKMAYKVCTLVTSLPKTFTKLSLGNIQ